MQLIHVFSYHFLLEWLLKEKFKTWLYSVFNRYNEFLVLHHILLKMNAVFLSGILFAHEEQVVNQLVDNFVDFSS